MEISSNLNTDRVTGLVQSRPPSQAVPAASDSVDLSQTAALDEALRSSPEVRTESVARARELLNQPAYPPRETIKKIARLMASNLPEEF